MDSIRITAGEYRFLARLELDSAPQTCAFFLSLLPYQAQIIHVRWSGEACWIPLGNQQVPFTFENATSYPAPGQMLFYPGGYSETEMLLAYGAVRFGSRMGQLAGNHFLTIVEGLSSLPELGRAALWEGAQNIILDRA